MNDYGDFALSNLVMRLHQGENMENVHTGCRCLNRLKIKDIMENQNKRKAFQHLPGESNPQFLEDGKRIYLELRKKYPNNTDEDLDNILNGICASMTCLMYANVDKSDHLNFLQLIYSILKKNLP